MRLRSYNKDKDRDAVQRIWREIGWSDGSEQHIKALDLLLGVEDVLVGELEGSIECVVQTGPSSFRYLSEEISMCALMGVATGHAGRKQGLASHLTARAVAQAAAAGALTAGLGMFDQGYYNQLGFGTGAYAHYVRFDPALLTVSTGHRVPRRLGLEDWQAMHTARLLRVRRHGSVNIGLPEATYAEMLFTRNPVGLGYHDGPSGALSHYFWADAHKGENGPLHVHWLVFQTREQFLELVSLLKSLGDQINLVTMQEPPGIQLQVLMDRPFKQARVTDKSLFATGMGARSEWQMRICDLPGCLARTHLPGPAVRFNLRLSDPIAAYLDADASWRGVAGDYVVTLGPTSSAEPGNDPTLPTLATNVSTFTRLWLGVGPATGLAMTDSIAAPPELLAQLDRSLNLPQPRLDWDF